MRIIFLVFYIIIYVFSVNFLYSQSLPVGMTEYEKEILPEYIKTIKSSKGITTPPVSPVRTPAEWEEMDAIVISWQSYSTVLTEIVRNAREECAVYIVCDDSNSVKTTLSNAGVNLENTFYIEEASNTVWIRDYGPNSVYTNDIDSLLIVDWVYNRPRPDDDAIPSFVADEIGVPLYETIQAPYKLVHTGGNFMSDGFGTGFSSNLILDENSPGGGWGQDLTEAEIDTIMKKFMGINRYIKMTNLPYDGIHHIDMHIKLLDEETLLVGEYPEGVADGPQIEENLEYVLNNFNSVFGTPYKVVRIPMPPDAYGDYPDEYGDYRTYTNSLIINKTVLVPTYEEQYDTTALRIYQEAMPGYNIVGIDCNSTISASGAIHCISHEIGSKNPLLISHQELENVTEGHTPDSIRAKILHRDGIESASIFYKTQTMGEFQEISMVFSDPENNTWAGFISGIDVGSTVNYYIWAKSNTGKTQVRPITAPDGYWTYTLVYNHPPVANAGNNQEVTEGYTVNLNGNGSYDPEGENLTYSWISHEEITLSDTSVVNPGFIACQVSSTTTYFVSLTVSDGVKTSEPDTAFITINPNQPPVANAGINQAITENDTVYLNGNDSYDPEDEDITYSWIVPETINLSDTSIVNPEFIAPEVDISTIFEIILIVNDGNSSSEPDTVFITVNPNQPPVASAGIDQTITENDTVYLNGSNSYDPEGDGITYSWIVPEIINLSDTSVVNPEFIAPEVDISTIFEIILIVNDGNSSSEPDTVLITVNDTVINQAPVANAGNSLTTPEGFLVELDGSLSYDPDGDSITYSWIVPEAINLSDTSVVNPEFIAPEVDISTIFEIILIVNDGNLSSEPDTVLITVNDTVINQAPVADAGNSLTTSEGFQVVLDGSLSYDPDSDSITYLWIAPGEINLSDTTSVSPSFIAPDVDSIKIFFVILTVNDGLLQSEPDTVEITININQLPIANAGNDQIVNEENLVNLNGSESYDPEEKELIFNWSAPEGIILTDDNTSTPSFYAPMVNQDSIIVLKLFVNDGFQNSVTDTILVNIKNITGINSLDISENLIIYPNPNNGNFYIKSLDKNICISTIIVYNINSQIIYKSNHNNLNIENAYLINTNNLQKGIYYLKIITKNSVINKSFICE